MRIKFKGGRGRRANMGIQKDTAKIKGRLRERVKVYYRRNFLKYLKAI